MVRQILVKMPTWGIQVYPTVGHNQPHSGYALQIAKHKQAAQQAILRLWTLQVMLLSLTACPQHHNLACSKVKGMDRCNAAMQSMCRLSTQQAW